MPARPARGRRRRPNRLALGGDLLRASWKVLCSIVGAVGVAVGGLKVDVDPGAGVAPGAGELPGLMEP